MSVTVVALGDSFSCGEGVGLDTCPEQTWPALLCAVLPGSRLVNLSRAGARVRDVRRHQLPTAIATEAQLATVMVGLNDVIRSGLSAEQLTADLQVLVKGLVDSGASVLVARWHDPGAVLRLPIGLRRALGARLTTVNNAVDAAVSSAARRQSGSRVRDPYVRILDLAGVPELADPGLGRWTGFIPRQPVTVRLLAARGRSWLVATRLDRQAAFSTPTRGPISLSCRPGPVDLGGRGGCASAGCRGWPSTPDELFRLSSRWPPRRLGNRGHRLGSRGHRPVTRH